MNFSGKVNNGPAASRTIMWMFDILEAFEGNRRAVVLAHKTMIVLLLKVIMLLLFFIISLRVVCKNVALIFFHTQNNTSSKQGIFYKMWCYFIRVIERAIIFDKFLFNFYVQSIKSTENET